MTKLSARCHCGAVKLESDSEPILQFICHCSDCREVSKTDFTTTAFFQVESTRSSGDVTVIDFEADCGSPTSRESCSNCGTFMFDKSERFPTLVGVVVQTIEDPFAPQPNCHVWISSKLDGITIADDLPQHEKDLA